MGSCSSGVVVSRRVSSADSPGGSDPPSSRGSMSSARPSSRSLRKPPTSQRQTVARLRRYVGQPSGSQQAQQQKEQNRAFAGQLPAVPRMSSMAPSQTANPGASSSSSLPTLPSIEGASAVQLASARAAAAARQPQRVQALGAAYGLPPALARAASRPQVGPVAIGPGGAVRRAGGSLPPAAPSQVLAARLAQEQGGLHAGVQRPQPPAAVSVNPAR